MPRKRPPCKKYRVEIAISFYHTEDVTVDTFIVEHDDKTELNNLIDVFLEPIIDKNEDRASYDYTVSEYKEPEIITLAEFEEQLEYAIA